MSSDAVRRIVLATDLGDQSPELFAHCLALALQAKAELDLVHILAGDEGEPGWRHLPTVRQLLERWGVLGPGATPEHLAGLGIRVCPLDFAPTDPSPDRLAWGAGDDVTLALTRRVAELAPDLLVLGTHSRHGFDRLLQPSVSRPVARDAHRVTLFVPSESKGFVDLQTGRLAIGRVMVPITTEVDPQPLIDELAKTLGAFGVGACSFTFVHVGSDATLPTPKLPTRTDWAWKTDRRTGSVVEQILEAEVEHRPDLVAMATAGASGILDALRGTTTERVLRRTRTPLLTVPVG